VAIPSNDEQYDEDRTGERGERRARAIGEHRVEHVRR